MIRELRLFKNIVSLVVVLMIGPLLAQAQSSNETWQGTSGAIDALPVVISAQETDPPDPPAMPEPGYLPTPAENGYLGADIPPSHCQNCGTACGGACGHGVYKFYRGVDEATCRRKCGEPLWADAQMIPWEAFAYGEYVGPHRTPHVPVYRCRVNDEIEFVYQLTREQSIEPYRLMVGDVIEISSSADDALNQPDITILSDGSVSLRLIGRVMAARKTMQELQDELNERYGEYFETYPAIVVRGTTTETATQDLINAVDNRFGTGGQARRTVVSPDGTVQLPMIGSVPTVGLTLDEVQREVNMRYRERIRGFAITPILVTRAPRFVYVLGEVAEPGRVELTGPTTAIQALALAGGWNSGGNLRQIVVLRRDECWRLMALRLDLAGGLHGQRPFPSDEIWLRDSDIVLIPKRSILVADDLIELVFTRGLYGVFPLQVGLNFAKLNSI